MDKFIFLFLFFLFYYHYHYSFIIIVILFHLTFYLLCNYLIILFNPCQEKGTLGAVSIRKTVLPGMAIPMLKIRRPNGRLIFNMENAIRR